MKNIFFGFLAIIGVGIIMFMGTYNGLVSKDENVNQKVAVVQADLQRRYDLIPNLVATVKGIATQEKEVFLGVTEARSKVGSLLKVDAAELASNPDLQKQLADAQAEMSGALSRLIAVAENYPDLKSAENFLNLQTQLEGTENRIKTSRRDVQIAVSSYNKAVRTFPGNIIAGMTGFKTKTFYEADDGAEEAPEVSFGE